MAPRKTKFSFKWLEKKDKNDCLISTWCSAAGNDEYSAHCRVCNATFSIHNQGFIQLIKHADGEKHKKYYSSMKNQAILFKSPSSSKELVLSSDHSTAPIPLQDKILKAEILILLTAVKNNYSFASITELSLVLSDVFDDSEIAKKIKLSDKKARYVINFGLAPYFKSQIFKDVAGSYVIYFDETTTRQTKKQMDIYISYWSETKGRVIHSYCESQFLGKAGAEKLFEIIKDFIDKNDLNIKKFLQLSMDGPNVNLSLQQKINNHLALNSLPPLIDIGTCCLHVMHNALRKGFEKLSFNVDKFAIDIHQWFRLSPARKEDFHKLQVELLSDVLENHVLLRHVSTRWLTLGPVCDRLIEQYPVLEHYFLKEIPSKYDAVLLERYNRIVSYLKDPFTIIHLHFVSFLANLFKPYMLILQRETPIIHILHAKLSEFLRSIFLKFIKHKVIGDKKGINLIQLDPHNAENWLEKKNIDLGCNAKKAIDSSDAKDNTFYLSVRSCYTTIASYLCQKLPIGNPFINDAQCLCPLNRKKNFSKECISRLTCYLPHLLLSVDRINEEWLMYMCDEDLVNLTDDYTNAGFDICKYWNQVSKIKDCSGSLKYQNLSLVAKACLTVSAANAIPERGFSVNNAVVTKEKSSLSNMTIKSIRICKDTIRQHNNDLKSILISKSLLNSVRKSHAEYASYIEQKKQEKLTQQKKRKAEEEAIAAAKEQKEKNLLLEEKLYEKQKEEKLLLESQNAAQNLLNEASKKLNKAVDENNKNEIKVAQMMINAANTEIALANSKLMECCKEQEQLKQKLKLKF